MNESATEEQVRRGWAERPLEDALAARNVELVGLVERLFEVGGALREDARILEDVRAWDALAAEWKEAKK